MQTFTCQPLSVLTQAMSGFGEQREVHENAKSDRRFNGAGPANGDPATKCRSTYVVSSARRQERNSLPPATEKEARNEPKPQRVQHDEVEAAARASSHRPTFMVDETHAVFDVVKEATAHALATMSWDKIDMSVPNACSRARGGRGRKKT